MVGDLQLRVGGIARVETDGLGSETCGQRLAERRAGEADALVARLALALLLLVAGPPDKMVGPGRRIERDGDLPAGRYGLARLHGGES